MTTVPRNKRKLFKSNWAWAYFFIAPTIIGLIVLNIYPFFESIRLSMYSVRGLFGKPKFVGFENFAKFFADPANVQIIWNTLYFVILTVPVGILLALILASLLNNNIKGRSLYRGIYFSPLIVAPAAVAMVWRWIFNADYGILNQFLALFKVAPVNWLSNPNISMISIAIISIWSSVGYDLVLLLAGLQGISRSYYEASDIDGANAFQKFRFITVPLISPTLFFVVMMRVMGSLKQFDTIYMLIKNTNPAYKQTVTLMVTFYDEAFVKSNKGYASAIVLITFVIIAIFTAIQFAAEKKLVNYD